MKRLILVLIVPFLLAAGTAFAANVNCIMYASENKPYESLAGHHLAISSNDYFTIETDEDTGVVVGFSNLFGSNVLSYEYGGWNTEDSALFDAGEQIFKDGVTYNLADIVYDGSPISENGHGLWFRGMANPLGMFPDLVFNYGILGITYDPNADLGVVFFGPHVGLQGQYTFHSNVPIPSAVWLLGSGLIGLIGFRKKVRKEVAK